VKRHDFIHDFNFLSFPQEKRVGNPSFAERFRTSRNDRVLLTYLAESSWHDEDQS
jgi:hypothetical protein